MIAPPELGIRHDELQPSLFQVRPVRWWTAWAVPISLFAAALISWTIDGSIALWVLEHDLPKQIQKVLMLSEPFGHGLGVFFIFAAVFLLDPVRRFAVPRLMVLSLGAGILADVFKVVIARPRPGDFHLLEGQPPGSFGPWFPSWELGSRWQSFPSGHTAVAVGLACGLAALYPRGRGLFALLAVLVACQRLEEGAHYPSDLLFGAAVAAAVSSLCLRWKPVAGFFDRREGQWLADYGPRQE